MINIKLVLTLGLVVAIGAGLLFVGAQPESSSARPAISAENADVVVYKTEFCGCCLDWVAHLRDSGLETRVVNVTNTTKTREHFGIPHQLASCHTAKVGKYWVEGHVPADLVQQLLTQEPQDIRGLAVPGMPAGSPGMPSPSPVEYDIVAYHADGSTSIYATRQGKSTGK